MYNRGPRSRTHDIMCIHHVTQRNQSHIREPRPYEYNLNNTGSLSGNSKRIISEHRIHAHRGTKISEYVKMLGNRGCARTHWNRHDSRAFRSNRWSKYTNFSASHIHNYGIRSYDIMLIMYSTCILGHIITSLYMWCAVRKLSMSLDSWIEKWNHAHVQMWAIIFRQCVSVHHCCCSRWCEESLYKHVRRE